MYKVQFGICLLIIVFVSACAPQRITPLPAAADTPTTTATRHPSASPVPIQSSSTADSNFASDGCRIYRNAQPGYSFHYPADAQIQANDEPLNSFSILGPVKDGDQWPFITISHPADRQDYRPPKDADLEKWLADHNLRRSVIPHGKER